MKHISLFPPLLERSDIERRGPRGHIDGGVITLCTYLLIALILPVGCRSTDTGERFGYASAEEEQKMELARRREFARKHYKAVTRKETAETGKPAAEAGKEPLSGQKAWEEQHIASEFDRQGKARIKAEQRYDIEKRNAARRRQHKAEYNETKERLNEEVVTSNTNIKRLEREKAENNRKAKEDAKAAGKRAVKLTRKADCYGPGSKDFKSTSDMVGEIPRKKDMKSPEEKLQYFQALVIVKMIPGPASDETGQTSKIPEYTCVVLREKEDVERKETEEIDAFGNPVGKKTPAKQYYPVKETTTARDEVVNMLSKFNERLWKLDDHHPREVLVFGVTHLPAEEFARVVGICQDARIKLVRRVKATFFRNDH